MIYDGMKKIVSTYQSAFLSEASSFAKAKGSTMKVTIPTRSNVASAGKQRYKRSQEHGIILSRKKAKARTNSHHPFALPGHRYSRLKVQSRCDSFIFVSF